MLSFIDDRRGRHRRDVRKRDGKLGARRYIVYVAGIDVWLVRNFVQSFSGNSFTLVEYQCVFTVQTLIMVYCLRDKNDMDRLTHNICIMYTLVLNNINSNRSVYIKYDRRRHKNKNNCGVQHLVTCNHSLPSTITAEAKYVTNFCCVFQLNFLFASKIPFRVQYTAPDYHRFTLQMRVLYVLHDIRIKYGNIFLIPLLDAILRYIFSIYV